MTYDNLAYLEAESVMAHRFLYVERSIAMDEMILEREMDIPEEWESDVIMRRNRLGDIEIVDVPDDTEEE